MMAQARAISDIIKRNYCLECIDLGNNKIGNLGFQAISDALKINDSLISINLLGLITLVKKPSFSKEVVEYFLINFGVPVDLVQESKSFLVGRPIVSTFFVQSWRSLINDGSFSSSLPNLITLRTTLLKMTVEKIDDFFKKKDQDDVPILYV
jgi:hypothetical protein